MDKTERWTASKKQWPEEDPSGLLFPSELWTAHGAVDCPWMGGGEEGGEEVAPRAWSLVSATWYYLP